MEQQQPTTSLVPLNGGNADRPLKPNRKPRYRNANNIWEVRKLKELWLRTFRACGDPQMCCDRVGRDIRTFYRWLEADKAFKAEYERLRDMWVEVTGEVLQSLDLQATVVLKEALEQTDDGRLRAEIAIRVLRAHGHLTEKTVTQHTGPDGGPVKVIHSIEILQPKEE